MIIVLSLCIVIASYYAIKYQKLCREKNEEQFQQLKQFEQENSQLRLEAVNLKVKIEDIEQQYQQERDLYNQNKQKYADELDQYALRVEQDKIDVLNKAEEQIAQFYEQQQKEKDKVVKELESLSSTLKARQEALVREQLIKDNKEDYCLTLSVSDENDLRTLIKLKPKLHNPRILSMLIWQTYFQKQLTSLCNKIVGTSAKTGIYKITNQVTDECYVGQAVNIADRWKEHAKCGLGIDTPDGNKLYKSMLEYGLQNFSWEVIEECSKNDLDEKEAYYIDAYQSKEYGLNTLAGRNVKKK